MEVSPRLTPDAKERVPPIPSLSLQSQFPEEIPLSIPAPLKAHMEDECFWILCGQKLLKLPRKPNIEDLLRQFYYHNVATPTEEMSSSLLSEILDGVKIYFDFMLEDHLLYGPEREQYRILMDQHRASGQVSHKAAVNSHPSPSSEQVEKDSSTQENSLPEDTPKAVSYFPLNTSSGNPQQPHHLKLHLEHTPGDNSVELVPSQVYGAEHLLRLFLKFPLFLSQAQLPVSHVQLLHTYFKELLAYLCNRRTELFLEGNYEDLMASGEVGTMQKEREEPPTTSTSL